MGRFSRRVRELQTVFPSSSAEISEPRETSELVSFVHPFPGRAAQYGTTIREIFASPAALTPSVATPAVPEGFYDWYLFSTIRHDAGVTQIVFVRLIDPGSVSMQIARMDLPTGTGEWGWIDVAHAGLTGYSAARPVVVPPGFVIQVAGNLGGVAYSVQIDILRIRLALAQEHP